MTTALDPFTAPGRNRPAPSPAALAMLATCRKAKQVADTARAQSDGMPGKPDVSAAGGEVSIVVHPKSLADWKQWMHALGIGDARGDSTGARARPVRRDARPHRPSDGGSAVTSAAAMHAAIENAMWAVIVGLVGLVLVLAGSVGGRK